LNRDLGNEDYAQKQAGYSSSQFALTRKIAEENHHWNSERIAARQNWMSKQAISIWRVAQLHTFID
jgi:Protein of unknown function (DUF1524)